MVTSVETVGPQSAQVKFVMSSHLNCPVIGAVVPNDLRARFKSVKGAWKRAAPFNYWLYGLDLLIGDGLATWDEQPGDAEGQPSTGLIKFLHTKISSIERKGNLLNAQTASAVGMSRSVFALGKLAAIQGLADPALLVRRFDAAPGQFPLINYAVRGSLDVSYRALRGETSATTRAMTRFAADLEQSLFSPTEPRPQPLIRARAANNASTVLGYNHPMGYAAMTLADNSEHGIEFTADLHNVPAVTPLVLFAGLVTLSQIAAPKTLASS